MENFPTVYFGTDSLHNECDSRTEIESLCRFHKADLELPNTDTWSFLMAISGCETSFCANNVPRFEYGYSKSSLAYKRSKLLQDGYLKWGDRCAMSYGPWQILWVNAAQFGYPLIQSPDNLSKGMISLPFVIQLLNSFYKFGAKTKEDFAAAYNAGPGCLKNKDDYPVKYVQKFTNFYNQLTQNNLGGK